MTHPYYSLHCTHYASSVGVLVQYTDIIYGIATCESLFFISSDEYAVLSKLAWQILINIGPEVRDTYIGIALTQLKDPSSCVRALGTLSHVGPVLLKDIAKGVVRRFLYSADDTNIAAMALLGELAPMHLKNYADGIAEMLNRDYRVNVRRQAITTLFKLEPTDLNKYVVFILRDPDARIRLWALRHLSDFAPGVLEQMYKQHPDAVVMLLSDEIMDVCQLAIRTLCRLAPTVLNTKSGNMTLVLFILSDAVAEMRIFALKCLFNIVPYVLKQNTDAILTMLGDDDPDVRRVAVDTLVKVLALDRQSQGGGH